MEYGANCLLKLDTCYSNTVYQWKYTTKISFKLNLNSKN